MAAYVPYIIMAAGTAAQMNASRQEANERRDVLNKQLARAADTTDKAVDMVEQEGQRFSPQARQQAMQEQETHAYDQSQKDLQQGAGGADIATAGGGNVSKDFLTSRAQRAVEEGTRLTAVARELAKVRSAGMLGNEDALSRAKLAGGLGSMWSTTKAMGGATGLDAQSVQTPGYGGLGKIASGIGAGMAAGGMGGGTDGVDLNPSSMGYTNSLDRASDLAARSRGMNIWGR